MPLSWHQSHVLINYIGDNKHTACLTASSSALVVCTKMDKKCKSTLPSVMQVKNQQKTISTKDKLDITCRIEKGERIVDVL